MQTEVQTAESFTPEAKLYPETNLPRVSESTIQPDTREFTTLSLEELRQQQQGRIFSKSLGPTSQKITQLPPEYAEKMRIESERYATPTLEQMQAAASKPHNRPRPEPRMLYDVARPIFWECLKAESALTFRSPEVDRQNREHVQAVLRYAIAEAGSVLDPTKGIAFVGTVGSGKTWLMQCLRRFLSAAFLPTFQVVNTLEVYVSAVEDISELDTFKRGAVCFDDLGQEPLRVQSFGNYLDVLGSILTARHQKWEKTGLITHVTSNLSIAEIESRYGSRVADRLRAMCTVVEFGGTSRRK